VKPSRLLPWVGWNIGDPSLLLFPEHRFDRGVSFRPFVTSDPFVELTKVWWERSAATEDWKTAVAIGKLSAERRPSQSYGWENWAWALHKSGETAAAYKVLAPLLRKLKLPGPPSGRAAFSLACFCGTMNKFREGTRWLRLAYNLSTNKDSFRVHALLEPDLREIWPGVPELREEACSFLE
jgi:hypothetical protein